MICRVQRKQSEREARRTCAVSKQAALPISMDDEYADSPLVRGAKANRASLDEPLLSLQFHPAQAQSIGDHRNRAEGHGCAGDDRAEQTQGCHWNAQGVIEKGPK